MNMRIRLILVINLLGLFGALTMLYFAIHPQ